MVIETHGLTRKFGDNTAVQSLELSIPAGELFGLVGPDGAGKTTTLRLLAGLLKLDAGEGKVAGFDLATQAEQIKPRIGYMAQEFSLYGELTVAENLMFFAEIYDVQRQQWQERSHRLLEFAGLEQFKSRRAAKLSGGMKKKLALACTLIHQPAILLLDEPTTGVDPISRREFWEILTELNLQGTTILVSTPYMDEADRCQRVGLMYEGQLVICDRPSQIRAELPGQIVELRPADWRAARQAVVGLPGLLQVQTYGERLHLIVDDAERRMPQVRQALAAAQVEFEDMHVTQPQMEQAFISLIHRLQAGEAV